MLLVGCMNLVVLYEPCCAVGPAILCQKFSFFSNCHIATLCMHKGIMIERNLLENSIILEKKENLLFTEMPPLKNKSFGLKIEMWNFGCIKGTI